MLLFLLLLNQYFAELRFDVFISTNQLFTSRDCKIHPFFVKMHKLCQTGCLATDSQLGLGLGYDWANPMHKCDLVPFSMYKRICMLYCQTQFKCFAASNIFFSRSGLYLAPPTFPATLSRVPVLTEEKCHSRMILPSFTAGIKYSG